VAKSSLVFVAAAVCCLLVATRAHAQDDRLFVRGYGGASFSSANNGGDSEQAGTFGGGVGVHLTRHLAVVGDVGYVSTIASEEGAEALRLVTALITLVSGVNADVRLKAKTLTVMGGGRFTFGDPGGRVVLFAEGQGGVARSTFKLEITSSDSRLVTDATRIFEDVIGKSSSSSPAIAAAGGADIRISRRLAAEAVYRYLRLFGDAKANIHQVLGGIVVRF
jgi:opacity protein-like surface antigen